MEQKISYDRVIRLYYFTIKDLDILSQIKHFFKCIILFIATEYLFDHDNEKYDFIFFNTTHRQDHRILFENIYQQCDRSKTILELKLSIAFNIKNIKFFSKNLHLIKLMDKEYHMFEKIIIYLKIVSLSDFVRKAEKIECKNIVVYSDLKPCEDLIVRVQNAKGANTISLQHALFIDYSDFPNINMLNYLDVPSKYFLAWGESTRKLINQYNNHVIINICGKPTTELKIFKQYKYKSIGIIFDQPMFKQYNKKMLEIAYEYVKKNKYTKILLRKHPLDDLSDYELDFNIIDLSTKIDEVDFIIAHTSSLIYEYLAFGYRVYKLKSKVPFNVISGSIQFSDFTDLELILSREFSFVKESKKHIKYVGIESKIRYKEFFNKI